MKNNKLFIFIAVLLTAIAIFLTVKNLRKSTIDLEKTSFAVEDTAAINKIFLADKQGNQILLERVSPMEWTLNGKYPARQDAIVTLLETMKKVELKVPVGKNASENILKDLSARAIKVEIYQNDMRCEPGSSGANGELKKVYYVGGPTPDNMGTFMMLEIDGKFSDWRVLRWLQKYVMLDDKKHSDPCITHIPGFFGYLSTRYIIHEIEWKSTLLFKSWFSDIDNIKVEYFQRPGDSYEIFTKPNGSLGLKSLKFNAEVKDFDTLALKQYLSYYRNIHFEGYEKFSQELKDSILSTPPVFRISLNDKSGKTYTVTTYRIKAPAGAVDANNKPVPFDLERQYAKINNDEDLALIQFYEFDKLLKPVSWFEQDPHDDEVEKEK